MPDQSQPELDPTNAPDETTPGIGHNEPPSEIEIIRTKLAQDHAPLVERQAELKGQYDRVPEDVDADNVGDVADLVKLITANMKSLEGARVAEKELYLVGVRAVDGFFKALFEPMRMAKNDLGRRITEHQRRAAEQERRRREAEARRQREEAEARAREAERLRRDAEERERAARAEQERVEREAREARQAEERRRREAEEAHQRELQEAKDLQEVAEKEADTARQRVLDQARENEKRAERERAERDAAERREQEEREARIAAEDAAKDAEKAVAEASAAEKAANAKAADLDRQRGDLGAVASLRTTWDFEIVDRNAIPFERIAAHFSMSDVEKAVRRYVAAGNRELEGVRIFEQHHSQVR